MERTNHLMGKVALFFQVWILLNISGSASRLSHAEPPKSTRQEKAAVVEKLYAEGAALYHKHKYRQAIEKFQKAFQIYPEANLLYNTAKCFEAVGDIGKALEYYQNFIQSPLGDLSAKTKAEAKIALLKQNLKKKQKTNASYPASESLPRASHQNAKRTSAAKKTTKSSFSYGKPALLKEPAQRKKSSLTRVVKWISGTTTVLASIGGAIAFALGQADHDRIEEAKLAAGENGIAPMTHVEAESLRDSGSFKKRLGYGLWASAGAALTTFIIMIALDDRESTGEKPQFSSKAAFMAAPLPKGGGAMSLQWSF